MRRMISWIDQAMERFVNDSDLELPRDLTPLALFTQE